jgi:hypothetical protein
MVTMRGTSTKDMATIEALNSEIPLDLVIVILNNMDRGLNTFFKSDQLIQVNIFAVIEKTSL